MSNALLMSVVASSVRCSDFGIFRRLCMCCVNEVSSVVVEWFDRKQCFRGDRGVCDAMFVRTSLTSILRELQSSEISLWKDDSVGVLFGLKMGAVLGVFQFLVKEL